MLVVLELSLADVLRQESKRHAGRKKGRRRRQVSHGDSVTRDADVQGTASKSGAPGFCHQCFVLLFVFVIVKKHNNNNNNNNNNNLI